MLIMSHQAPYSERSHSTVAVALIGCLLIALAAPASGQQISNPKLYKKTLRAASQAFEYYGEYDAPEERRRVNGIGYRLAAESGFHEFPFTFYVVDMPEPNAFALPGGQIFVTRGMLNLGLDDDMLANLLGHELAHVIYKHGTRMQRRAALLNALGTALMLGVLVGADDDTQEDRRLDPYGYGESRKGSLVQGTAAATMALSELLLRDYSRDFEDEADDEGQRLAAAAGYDPAGAHKLWTLMNARIPQAKVYGYWRTHPFSDQRMRAAEVRARELKILEGEPADDYRAKVQALLLEQIPEGYEDAKAKVAESSDDDVKSKTAEEAQIGAFLELSALHAWPQGRRAEAIRLRRLHEERDVELDKGEVERDYGKLLRAYGAALDEVRALTPESDFLATLEKERDHLQSASRAIYPKALEIWKEGIYQTPFLETFLSNYPEAPEVPEVALALGNAYSRLQRQTDAVEQFLRATEAGPESEAGKRALDGLRNLAPYLDRLAALQQLAEDVGDEKLRELSHTRLAELAPKYKEIENGAAYLKRFPEGEQAGVVRERLEKLADDLYGEVVLYQGVGDHVKALERIRMILTHAPLSKAAEQLRENAVFEG